jgi:hypothetical protein
VHFKDDFHIDVPAYHLNVPQDARTLATEDGWEDSDPKAIYKWWKDTISDSERPCARRIVRYLKMWAALQFEDDARPSSILLTVLAAKAYVAIDMAALNGDDEVLKAVVANVLEQLNTSPTVSNPVNRRENLNRLSDEHYDVFTTKLRGVLSVAGRALVAPTKAASADIWSEAFGHFFPIPASAESGGIAAKFAEDRAVVPARFDPLIVVEAKGGGKTYIGTNEIGPIPKGCEIVFKLANAPTLPPGATVHWMVRNAGREAEIENDLGHQSGQGGSNVEQSAYRGDHFMDVTIKRNGTLIGARRVPVKITGLGLPLRNPPRPAWTKLLSKRR